MSFQKKKKSFKLKNKKLKLKKNKKLTLFNLHIKASFKNTILNLTSSNGNLLKQLSTKSLKKTSFKKNTPYNIHLIVMKLNKLLKLKHISNLNLFFNGTGYGRRHIVRNLKRDVKIRCVYNTTPIPFNGCRLKKKKRR